MKTEYQDAVLEFTVAIAKSGARPPVEMGLRDSDYWRLFYETLRAKVKQLEAENARMARALAGRSA